MKTIFIFLTFNFIVLLAWCQNEQKQKLSIGDNYGGGIIFSIDPSGQNALVAAPFDQSNAIQWGCSGFKVGASGLTDGESNTIKIVKKCGPGTAAYICDTLKLSGYTDWYLPSQFELDLLYQNAEIIKTLSSGVYCSSTEYTQRNNLNNCWVQNFGQMGRKFYWDKNRKYYVRAIRNTADDIKVEKAAVPEKSNEELLIDKVSTNIKLEESTYSDIKDVKIGDIVKFKSSYGDLIVGIVIEKSSNKKILIKTYPTPGFKLIVEESWKNVTKVKSE
jgi:hypothetical protein